MRTYRLLTIVLFLNLATFSFARAQNEDIELEKIVVTPYRYDETLAKTAGNITVISQKDIDNSNAQKVVDILRSVPGVVVRDWYGNGVTASVDMAGFGGQAALNVLVLLDGRRINDADLSGVDWSQVPLEQVERIEVIRGGSGGVLYGDNASSGVINIITKKGAGKPKTDAEIQYGSYDMNAQKLSLSGGIDDKFSYWFNGGHQATHGYRNNSFNKTKDFGSKLEYSPSEIISVHFNSGFHYSDYGMPASLWQDYIDQHSRRYAKHGDDHAINEDYYLVLGTKSSFSGLGKFDIDFTYRHKNTDSFFLTSKLNTQKNEIETYGITPKYTLGNIIFNRDNKFVAGIDYYRVYYKSDKYNRLRDDDRKNYTRINKNSIGSYIQNAFSISKELVFVAGYRYEVARYVFAYHDFTDWNPDIDKKIEPKQRAFNTGLVYNYGDNSKVFLNVSKSFRFPEVDEFTYNDASWQQQLNTDLEPQSAMNYQLGLQHKFSDSFENNFSLFRMNVKDELYYKSDGGATGDGQNENYNKTVHQGIEYSLDAKLTKGLILFGNYTFTESYFVDGTYNKNEIPMVPRHKGSIGLRFLLPNNIAFNMVGTYVGKRYFLNDQANAYSRLNGYMVADTNLSWRHKDLTVTFGINNLFNKKYSEYAGVVVNDTWESSTGITWPAGSKFYYPSPERNFNLKLEYLF